MIQTGYAFFDPLQPVDASLAVMSTPDHPALCLITRKLLFNAPQPTPPTGILLGLTGYTGWGPNVRVKLGVVGVATYACSAAAAATKSPDGEGFYIAIAMDATCQTDSLQVSWLAYWD